MPAELDSELISPGANALEGLRVGAQGKIVPKSVFLEIAIPLRLCFHVEIKSRCDLTSTGFVRFNAGRLKMENV